MILRTIDAMGLGTHGARYLRGLLGMMVGLPMASVPAPAQAEETPVLAPIIVQQPKGGKAAVTEHWSFQVVAVGTQPFTYQWYRNGSSISRATNQVLLLTNLTTSRAGRYDVRVSNEAGSVRSASATLEVSTTAPRVLVNGPVTEQGGALISIFLTGNGIEHGLSFSVLYDTNRLLNPGFVPAHPSDTVGLDTSQAVAGLVGVELTRDAGTTYDQTNQLVGVLTFDLQPGATAMQAGLTFTNSPLPVAAQDLAGTSLLLDAALVLSVERVDLNPALNLQSGLFEQRLRLGNPGPQTLSNVVFGAYGAGTNRMGEAIRLFNAQASGFVDLDGDNFAESFVETVRIPSLTNGQVELATMEYYVIDHVTVPDPKYMVMVEPGTPIALRFDSDTSKLFTPVARMIDGRFALEFATSESALYYVEYANTMEALMDKETVRVALPAISGTGGSVRWIDTGPPKTEAFPAPPTRFYRVRRVSK